jgi:Cft2 family RNA processing exonuclease
LIRYRALGAAGTMGESAHLVEIEGAAVLLDAGCHPKTGAVASPRAAQAAGTRAVVLSHAHLDHSGGLPIMLRGLPNTPVFATAGTRALTGLALRDHLGRVRAQAGKGGLPFSEAERLGLPWSVRPLGVPMELWTGGPRCTLLDAGHIAGAAGVLLEHAGRRLFYTGDTHLAPRVWQRGAHWPRGPIDVLVMESTHGANPTLDDVEQPALEARLGHILESVLAAGGQVLVPVFAFGKAQEMLAQLACLRRAGRLSHVPVYLGGLAARVNALAERHTPHDARRHVDLTLNEVPVRPLMPAMATHPPPGPAIFLVGSGMLAEGSLAGALADQLMPDPKNAVIFVGYLDPDTPGHELRGGGRPGAARIEAVPFSAHARRTDLVEAAVAMAPKQIVLVHGEESARQWLAEALALRLPETRIHRPLPDQVLTLA